MHKIRLATLAAGGLLALTAYASAADLARPVYRRPVAVAAPLPYTWTGFYIGGNLGYGVSRDPATETTVAGPATLIAAAPAGLQSVGPGRNRRRPGRL
jgi:outer membrane immunogenic protein